MSFFLTLKSEIAEDCAKDYEFSTIEYLDWSAKFDSHFWELCKKYSLRNVLRTLSSSQNKLNDPQTNLTAEDIDVVCSLFFHSSFFIRLLALILVL